MYNGLRSWYIYVHKRSQPEECALGFHSKCVYIFNQILRTGDAEGSEWLGLALWACKKKCFLQWPCSEYPFYPSEGHQYILPSNSLPNIVVIYSSFPLRFLITYNPQNVVDWRFDLEGVDCFIYSDDGAYQFEPIGSSLNRQSLRDGQKTGKDGCRHTRRTSRQMQSNVRGQEP
ncbi:hypothetical protein MJO28_004070 [Puccinia striiformis f. sp. tritici]|uniref:Uncharacterized protein n=1 Tax=Puccinia striiformis f. sp. tritici TaxID=168172 RepID=A0ACC0EP42_9BASI|nr:hypothetical protein MJO28_004070 [Puccinia striiformis f. sp. tritici]